MGLAALLSSGFRAAEHVYVASTLSYPVGLSGLAHMEEKISALELHRQERGREPQMLTLLG